MRLMLHITIICAFTIGFFSTSYSEDIFYENFESTENKWQADDNNVWQFGEVKYVGPKEECYEGKRCAGTVLCDNFPSGSEALLISPIIDLPPVEDRYEIHLSFYQWFDHTGDGNVQIQEFNKATGEWLEWQLLENCIINSYHTTKWTYKNIDITEFSTKEIRIGFYHKHESRWDGNVAPGWYIDKVQIVKKIPQLTSNLETGWEDWHPDGAIWDIGEPVEVGPAANGEYNCHSGNKCWGTVLFDNYPTDVGSRSLVSPSIFLPSIEDDDEEIHLKFWQWFDCGPGFIDISTYNHMTNTWREWKNIDSEKEHYNSTTWLYKQIDLTEYESETIRLAFKYGVNGCAGWYIDDIDIEKKVPEFQGDFEDGWGGWSTDNEIWDVGVPSIVGPTSCHGGKKCIGTIIFDNSPEGKSRLVSPSINLPQINNEDEIILQFYEWYEYTYAHQSIQVRIFNRFSKEWYDWETIEKKYFYSDTPNSNGWELKTINLSKYATKKIQIGFLHNVTDTFRYDLAPGWYLDDIKVTMAGTTLHNISKLPIVKELSVSPTTVFKNGKLSIQAKIIIE